MLRFFTAPRLALNPNPIFEIGSIVVFREQAWNHHGALDPLFRWVIALIYKVTHVILFLTGSLPADEVLP